MKKNVAFVLIAAMLLSNILYIDAFAANNEILVYVNGEKINFDVSPVLSNGRTLVPMRKIFEAIDAEVTWDSETNTAFGQKKGRTVEIKIGEEHALVDNKTVNLDVAAELIGNHTMVPLRFVGESFGDTVDWDGKNNRIFITKNQRNIQAPQIEDSISAEQILSALPEGEIVFSPEDFMNSLYYNSGEQSGCSYKKVAVDGMPFQEAFQVDVTIEPKQNYDYSFTMYGTKNISKGDIVLMSVSMRNINSATDENSCSVELVYEQRESPWKKFRRATLSAGQKWQTFYAYFIASDDLMAEDVKMVVRVGGKPQLFEIGNFSMVNYKKSVSAEQMPAYSFQPYDGIEADASWRAEADERIEKYRKGDFKIHVVSEDGSPVSDAKLTVEMLKHEFDFGSVIWVSPENSVTIPKEFFETLKENFNTVVVGNDLKWPNFEKSQRAIDAVNWAKDNGLKIRGHTMVWDHTTHMPSDLKTIINEKEAVYKRFEDHIKQIGEIFDDSIYEWDALNEPVMNNQFRTLYGNEFAAQWFKWAKQYSPNTKRILNDTGIVGYTTPRYDQLTKIIEDLLANGAEIDGLGIQGHFGVTCNPENFYKQLDNLSKKFDLPIKVTEFTAKADDSIQAHFTRDILTEVFSIEKANGFVLWGHWEGAADSKDDSTVMYDSNWNLKPAGEQMRYLLFDKWWTNVIGVTDDDGEYASKGFYGDYQIVTEHNGTKQLDEITVSKGGANEFTIKLGQPQYLDTPVQRVARKSSEAISDDAWEIVRKYSFGEKDVSFVKSENLDEKSYSIDNKVLYENDGSLKVKSEVSDGKITFLNVFDGLDISTYTPYKITFMAKGKSEAEGKQPTLYPAVSFAEQKNEKFVVKDIYNEKNTQNLSFLLKEEEWTKVEMVYWVGNKVPNSLSVVLQGQNVTVNLDEITISTLTNKSGEKGN